MTAPTGGSTLPEGFLGTDAILVLATNIAAGLEVREDTIRRHVDEQMPFMATERWLMLGTAAGGDRQTLHEVVRKHSLAVAEAVSRGEPNTLLERLGSDPAFRGVPAAALQAELEPAQLHRTRRSAGGRIPRGLPPAASQTSAAVCRRSRVGGGEGMKTGAAGSDTTLTESRLPLPLLRRGKVREVYEVDAGHLLVVASDRVSAFDVVMREPIPRKGAVLTQISAFWFELLADVFPSHYVTARTEKSWNRCRGSKDWRSRLPAGRCWFAGLSRCPSNVSSAGISRDRPGRNTGAGERWPESRSQPAWSKARGWIRCSSRPLPRRRSGHDINVTVDTVAEELGPALTARLRQASFALYQAGRDHAASRGIIIADTKFEFGTDAEGTLRVIDEILTPDSSRFWPADRYAPGQPQPSFDKQPLRDYLASLKAAGSWDGEAPPPSLPSEVVEATSRRYLEAYKLLTGRNLERDRVMRTAPEGLWFIVGAWLIALGLILAALRFDSRALWIACVLWVVLAVWVVAFFRDPVRSGRAGRPPDPGSGRWQGGEPGGDRGACVHGGSLVPPLDLHERFRCPCEPVPGRGHGGDTGTTIRASSATPGPRSRASTTSSLPSVSPRLEARC